MSSVKDLVEEAKKRIVLLLVCVFGLSYLMSLTSSSVWINLPAAASLIILLRYLSIDIDMRRRGAAYCRPPFTNNLSQKKPHDDPKVDVEQLNWRIKVNSPDVEAAIDQFTRHLVSEWVTDLWYSRLTPDRDGPEELVQIINGVLAEISFRVQDINLIDLLTRDIINVVCSNLELYRVCRAKMGDIDRGKFLTGYHDSQLKTILASENKLHPALFSAETEHKVLQQLMGGLISFAFKSEDLQCSFFRFTVRELIACAVMRPVVNLANPRFINERIESFVLSVTNKTGKEGASSAQEASHTKQSSRTSSDNFLVLHDPCNKGVELVQLKHNPLEGITSEPTMNIANGSASILSTSSVRSKAVPFNHKLQSMKVNPLCGDSQPSNSRDSLNLGSDAGDGKNVGTQRTVGEWGQMLDIISRRKSQALAPEHLENLWTKGRNYKKKEGANDLARKVMENMQAGSSHCVAQKKGSSEQNKMDAVIKADFSGRKTGLHVDSHLVGISNNQVDGTLSGQKLGKPHEETIQHDSMHLEKELDGESSHSSEDDENNSVTGLDSPVTKVWDSKNNRHVAVSHIRHPLENSEGNLAKKTSNSHFQHQRLIHTRSGRKRLRPSHRKVPLWQEVERTTFLLGDGEDILNTPKCETKVEKLSDGSDLEAWGRVHSRAAAASSAPSISTSNACNSSVLPYENSLVADSFLKLRCEVLGANVVKSGSRTFAVYSISVTDADNNCWSIKRRFRHFEELHWRLKEFREYNLSLPPKHFLSSGLDVFVVRERCKLLDMYLKKLLQLQTVSRSIEVWDFLSVDSQTYVFSNSLSIIETLSVDLDDKTCGNGPKVHSQMATTSNQSLVLGDFFSVKNKENILQIKQNYASDGLESIGQSVQHFSRKNDGQGYENVIEGQSGSDSDGGQEWCASLSVESAKLLKASGGLDDLKEKSPSFIVSADPTIPTEWVPPNLSLPLLDLVDVIFQLQDGGWIRRQAFWIAKQVLQLGMGDAFDDWLIEKIQMLRKGSVIASVIKRVEQILWPDGIFITKHPMRQRPALSSSGSSTPKSQLASSKEEVPSYNKKLGDSPVDNQELEAIRLAKFVRELMIDNAPAALVGLVGRKEYERSAEDIYFFLQSSVCLKQLAFDLLELLLLSAFPELGDVVKQYHLGREQLGEVEIK